MAGILKLWSIYDHPTDQPDMFVARRWSIAADGLFRPENLAFLAPTLAALRTILHRAGLHPIPRSPDDDPVIVESWI